MEDNFKFYSQNEILEFLGIIDDFKNAEKYNKPYPYKDNLEDLVFNYFYITIPKQGIHQAVQDKISQKYNNEIAVSALNEINMLVHIPFYCERTKNTGCFIVNLTIRFRYDKTYKYGDITKSLPEVCYAIERHAKELNDFYILNEYYATEFMSNFVMHNQWAIGATEIISTPNYTLNKDYKMAERNN